MVEKLQIALLTLITILAFAIAIPSLQASYQGKNYQIRNLDPRDIGLDLLEDEFAYKPALDLQGGYSISFDVDLSSQEEMKLEKYEEVKSVISQRMALIGFKDFDFTSYVNQDEDIYRLDLITPDPIDENLAMILSSPGRLQVLVDDPEADQENIDSSTIYPGKKVVDISNEDIASVKVVSDSRIFSTDPETPYNFGLEIVFKPESKSKLGSALITNYSNNIPLIFSLDNSIVAVQASGYQIDPFSDNDSLLVYTLLADTQLNNSVLAAVIDSPSIETQVMAGSTIKMLPQMGPSALTNLKIITAVLVVLFHIAMVFYFRRRSLFVILSVDIFVVLLIALQKILNFNLSMSLIISSVAITSYFVMYIIGIAQKISTQRLSLKNFLEAKGFEKLTSWKLIFCLLILIPIIIFFENLLTVSVNQFIQGIILGVIIWLLFRYFYLLPIIKHNYNND
jgi:hypothetical protein